MRQPFFDLVETLEFAYFLHEQAESLLIKEEKVLIYCVFPLQWIL